MIYPSNGGVPMANADLSEAIKSNYNEAAEILSKSPRGAAALLRLCIQMLCKDLGQVGKNINKDIAELVKIGLPIKVQQALDYVRVVGNNAVHPGRMDLNDNADIAIRLFSLINLIADVMISQPNEIDKLYKTLPESNLKSIDKRDDNKK